MTVSKKRRIKEGPLEKKWQSYGGIGITATKGKDAIALREGFGGKYAIVKLYGGLWTNSPLKVLEEFKPRSLEDAVERFHRLAKKLGFRNNPPRSLLLFVVSFSN